MATTDCRSSSEKGSRGPWPPLRIGRDRLCMERFVVVSVGSTCEPRKPSAGSSRAAHGSRGSPFATPRPLASLGASQRLAARARAARVLVPDDSLRSPSDVRLTPFGSPSPCFPEPASPFQSTRLPDGPPAVPGGLKGRVALGGAPTTQAPQRSEERSESRPLERHEGFRGVAVRYRAIQYKPPAPYATIF